MGLIVYTVGGECGALVRTPVRAPRPQARARLPLNSANALCCGQAGSLGQGLVEYTPTLAARLAGVRTAALTLPGWAAADVVAAIAWRP